MKKIGMVLGAAAVLTLAGCKDPDYKYDTATDSQTDVKVVGEVPQSGAKPIEVATIEAKHCTCLPGTKHTEPCLCGAPDCACIVEKPVAPIAPEVVAPAAPAKPAVAPSAATTVYIVRSGDSLSRISKRHNVTISAIKRYNPNLKGDRIRIGQKLKIPGKFDLGPQAAPVAAPAVKKIPAGPYTGATKEYVVKSGDSLGLIAHRNGLTVRQLKDLNGLKKDTIRIGQKLKIPTEKVVTVKPTIQIKKGAAKKADAKKSEAKKAEAKKPEAKKPEAAPAAPAAAPAAVDAPAAPAAGEAPAPAPAEEEKKPEPAAAQAPAAPTYVVQEGDDMTGISIRWGVSAAAIRDLNKLDENDQLKPGQIIKLPPEAQQ